MATPRKRKATTPRKSKTKKSAKRSTSRRRHVPSPSDIATPPDDEEVFIPKRSAATMPPVVEDDDDDDAAVFVARPGRPVEVQSDWTQDGSRAPLGISNDEFFAGLEPRAMTAGGWTMDELRDHGMDVRGTKVTCRYGCGGSTSNVPGVSSHHYSCQYWQREGKTKTPF